MSEAIIAKRRKTKINYVENIENPPPNWSTTITNVASLQLLNDTIYEAPANAINNTLYVTAVGGSGASKVVVKVVK